MKKQLLVALLLLQAGSSALAQTRIVQWNFNSSFGNIPANGTAPAPSLGSGTLTLTGGVKASEVAGVAADPATTTNRAMSTTSYPAVASDPQSAGIEIAVSTTGYNAIRLSYYSKHSNTAANKVVVQYLNGSSGWQTIYDYTATATTNFVVYNIDLSAAVAAISNNASVRLRLVTDFATPSGYQASGSGFTYGSSGTIQYDLLTISGNSISCGTLATQQATGLRLLKTDNSSAQLTLNRGDGFGCLILCSASGIPAIPVNGTNYSASSTYGSGEAEGNAFAVYNTQVNNPSTHYFNINGLAAGTKYYIAAYEHSSTGYCYLTPGTVDSFYCNSTILYPGDVQFVGYDNNESSGRDAYVFTNLKELKKGTGFQIVNSRYEAGAAAGTRTNRWYAGDNDPYLELQRVVVTYTGTSLPAGSVISFSHTARNPTNLRINNQPTTDLLITDNFSISNLLSGSAPEQFFIVQGKFTSYGMAATDKYSLLDGHVLHGISYQRNWVAFSEACSAGKEATDRQSRLPPDIRCLNLYFSGNSNFGYYQPAQNHTGSQGLLLGQINTIGNWMTGAGSGNNDIASGVYATPFTISSSPTAANWTGSTGSNWFDCSNWENRYVPDSTADVTVLANTPAASIDVAHSLAAEYNGIATTRNLNITGSVNLSGNTTDKLLVYDALSIGNAASLASSGTGADTLVVRGSIQSANTNGLLLGNNGWLGLHGNRQLQPISVSLPGGSPVVVAALSLNNPPGISLLNGGFESLQKLELANGILSPVSAAAFHYMDAGCAISSPANYYGEVNKGWEKSYIDSKVFVRTNGPAAYTAPLGSKQKGVFAPMIIYPGSNANVTYEAGYTGSSHPNTVPNDISNPPVTKVSTQEYWTLISNPTNAAANLTLYYTPLSFVGGRGNDEQALKDLQIVQYWDSNMNSIRKWRLPTVPASAFNSGPNVRYGKISMGPNKYVTSLNPNDGYFTLGSATVFNTLPTALIGWAVQLQGNSTRLSWQGQQEGGASCYTIEKSMDGRNFYSLQMVIATGLPRYVCFDDNPANGWNYYRLKITGADGKIHYSSIEKVWWKRSAVFSVFPNPASDKFFVSLPSTAKATVSLYTADSKKVLEQVTDGSNFIALSVKIIPAGWYVLEYWDGQQRLVQKLLVK